MSSPGTGSDISRQDAIDLLHKLITESTKVQAMFIGRGGVIASLQGTVALRQDGMVWISNRKSPTAPSLIFGLADVSIFKYGDNRAFPGSSPTVPSAPHLSSALCFVCPDGAQVALFEIAV
jgi:hypothetical protein